MEDFFKFDINKFTAPAKIYFGAWTDEIIEELKKQIQSVEKFTNILLGADRIFLSAKGRSGLVISYAGIRLGHAGYDIFEVDHPLSPPIGRDETKKDVLFVISGSGTTPPVVYAAQIAKENGVPVLVITSDGNSPLGKLATEKIVTKSKTKDDINVDWGRIQLEGPKEPLSYLGSESEYKAFVISELIANFLHKRRGVTEDDARNRHKNVE
jgi:6-phospho-3-hexuloisomerase